MIYYVEITVITNPWEGTRREMEAWFVYLWNLCTVKGKNLSFAVLFGPVSVISFLNLFSKVLIKFQLVNI